MTDSWPLSLPLLQLSPHPDDVITWDDFRQGILVLGANGSGKTTGPLQQIIKACLRHGFGMLILIVKRDEGERIRRYLRETGREGDGRFFTVDGPFRFNFLAHEARQPDVQIENLVHLLLQVATLKRVELTGNEAHFWLPQKKKFLRNALSLLLMADEPVNLLKLYEILKHCPKDADTAKSDRWKDDSYLYQLIERIELNGVAPTAHQMAGTQTFGLVRDYYLREWPNLHLKTRSNVEADFTGFFDPLTRDALGDLFNADQTNLTPQDIFEGRVVVVDIPERQFYEAARYCAKIWAQAFQRAADRREYVPPVSRPVALVKDEMPRLAGEDDSAFQATCRSQGVTVIAAAQNYPQLKDAYGSADVVNDMAGNLVTKILCRQDDPETNDWASRVIGDELRATQSISTSDRPGEGYQVTVNHTPRRACQPKEFVRLKNGGPRNGGTVEAIVSKPGHLWRGKHPWMVCRWNQGLSDSATPTPSVAPATPCAPGSTPASPLAP